MFTDNLEDDNVLAPTIDNDDGHLDPAEIENELEWRKLRLEREKYLEEKSKTADNELSDGETESTGLLFKWGMKVLRKSETTVEMHKTEVTTTKKIIPRTVSEMVGVSDENKSRILHKAMKRSSFLARGDEALAKLAIIVKQNDNVSLGPKHSANFLFTHISPSVTNANNNTTEAAEDKETVDKKVIK